MTDSTINVAELQRQIEQAGTDHKLSPGAVVNLRQWLTESRFSRYVPGIADHVAAGKWQALDDAFWTVIPFGTGGRRGRMYPIGPAEQLSLMDMTRDEMAARMDGFERDLRAFADAV